VPSPAASPASPTLWNRVYRASERLPNRVRAVAVLTLPFVAFATNAALGTPAVGPLFALFVALTLFTLWAHLPVFAFSGPLPFSDQGLHVAGEVHPWDRVATIEPAEDGRNLRAVLDDGRRVRLRVRGAHTHDEFRDIVRRHKPEAVAF
jgi:hypothetical protein